MSPFQGLFHINNVTQGFVLLRPELLHIGALPLISLQSTLEVENKYLKIDLLSHETKNEFVREHQ